MDDRCIKCENPTALCLCTGKPIKNYYSKLAKYQNMEVARAKAIDIMEWTCPELEGEDWFKMEDRLTEIINSK